MVVLRLLLKKKNQLIRLGNLSRVGWSQGEAFTQKAVFCRTGGFPDTSASSVPNTKVLNKINLSQTCTFKTDLYGTFHARCDETSMCNMAH